jgi:hypothetical protein
MDETTPEKEARAPEILHAAEGEWREEPPPDRQPQFRCIVHPRGSVLAPGRWTSPADEPTEGV